MGRLCLWRRRQGVAEQGAFAARLKSVQAVIHNQDNREHDILDSDDYYQFEGGSAAAVRHLSGSQPGIYHNDHSRPERPRVGTLAEEVGRIVRARAANPKWIEGVIRHGYKGAFEIAATVDYLFAFAATARVVEDHHFDQLFEAYLEDDQVRTFIEQHNIDALREIAERFEEAIERGFGIPDPFGGWTINSATPRSSRPGDKARNCIGEGYERRKSDGRRDQ